MTEEVIMEEPKKSSPQPLSRRLMILTTAAIFLGNTTFVSSNIN